MQIRRLHFLLLVAAVLAVTWWFLRGALKRPLALPLPPLSATAFENANADVKYIGLKACAKCHPEQYESYLQTAHSKALATVDAAAEPPDAEFVHSASGKSYRVYRADGVMHHRESLAAPDGSVLAQDYPVKYLIGSGRHTRSYLVEDAGFLMESPITWYQSRQAWGMSPGYDRPQHLGFERAAGLSCIMCHVGRAEGDGLHSVVIHEQAIGCECCHGPGSLHAERQKGGAHPSESNDPAIFHPGRASRQLGEAICAQCHLRSNATVFVRGRNMTDFRPGLPLTDFRIDYQLDAPNERMKVVGHVEQMRLSRCYQASETLTCTTCHDPHHAPAPAATLSHYRSKCLECHAESACGLAVDKRTKNQPGDNCAACHMPQVSTDIPHVAFTHHRIGVHSSAVETPDEGKLAELVALEDISHLPELDRDRCLGLAYLEFAQTQRDGTAYQHYKPRAVELLESVRKRGLHDAYVDAGLARLYWADAPLRAFEMAHAALEHDEAPASERVNALFVIADTAIKTRQWPTAREALLQLIVLRRHSVDWMLLGLCETELGNDDAAIKAIERAAQINPYQSEIHARLARLYRKSGDLKQSEQHARWAELLANQARQRASPRE